MWSSSLCSIRSRCWTVSWVGEGAVHTGRSRHTRGATASPVRSRSGHRLLARTAGPWPRHRSLGMTDHPPPSPLRPTGRQPPSSWAAHPTPHGGPPATGAPSMARSTRSASPPPHAPAPRPGTTGSPQLNLETTQPGIVRSAGPRAAPPRRGPVSKEVVGSIPRAIVTPQLREAAIRYLICGLLWPAPRPAARTGEAAGSRDGDPWP
jgi:hypothetical protein